MPLVLTAMLVRGIRAIGQGHACCSAALTIPVLEADEITARQYELQHEEPGDEAGDTAMMHECKSKRFTGLRKWAPGRLFA